MLRPETFGMTSYIVVCFVTHNCSPKLRK